MEWRLRNVASCAYLNRAAAVVRGLATAPDAFMNALNNGAPPSLLTGVTAGLSSAVPYLTQ